MNLNQEMKRTFFEIQLTNMKKRKKSPLTIKSADHILKNYKKMFHLDSQILFTKENCQTLSELFLDTAPAELVKWMESLFP